MKKKLFHILKRYRKRISKLKTRRVRVNPYCKFQRTSKLQYKITRLSSVESKRKVGSLVEGTVGWFRNRWESMNR